MEGDQESQTWRPRTAERINGIKMNLGRMPLEQLMELEQFCEQRRIEAIADKSTVQDYIEHLYFPSGGTDD